MSDLIVLGLVPGTQTQITFLMWLIIAGSIAAILIVRANARTKLFQAWLIATSITFAVQRRPQL